MATPWVDTVRSTGQLSVSFHSTMSTSAWRSVTQPAVDEFNRLSQQHRLGVRLRVVSEGTANVIVNIADGSASFSSEGDTHTVSVAGRALHGHTSLLSRSGRVFQCYVFLPSDPQINTPSGLRPVGDGVKTVIAVHEFIHCCGLTNSEHSSDDIFTGNPSVDYGATPDRDVVEISAAGQGRRTAPPLFLRTSTINRVRGLWVNRRSGSRGARHTSHQRRGVMGGAVNLSGDLRGGQRRPGPEGTA